MLKIFGHRQAPNVRKVLWGCAEMSLRYELAERGGPFGGTDAAEYLAINPNGRVPSIVDDDGFALWESHAILRYLARKTSSAALYPGDLRERARVDQWLDWQAAHQAIAIRDLVGLTIKAVAFIEEGRLLRACLAAAPLFAIMEGVLGSSEFIAGDRFTIADIPVAVGYRRWATLPIERSPFPNLEAWFARIEARPGYRALASLDR
jgi:glutathione S-transferase